MTPERWKQIQENLDTVIALKPAERESFLNQLGNTDLELRQEVESLLLYESKGHSFFPSAAIRSLSEDVWQKPKRTRPPLVGCMFGPYQIREMLGAGGMGEVYRAHDPRLDRYVAVKLLPSMFANDADRMRRFQQEARAAAALNHPNILAIYDVGESDQGVPYVVSELLDGETLLECLRRGPLPPRKTVELALQMASGLAAAHDKGIIHRDLKPENLFLTADGRLKILDFGLAKLVGRGGGPVTELGLVMGTEGYMSPEQARGQPVDARSDIFAMGAIIYEMLSGQRAFPGETLAEAVAAILSRDPVALSDSNLAIPAAFKRVLRRCLEKNANERFPSARDVACVLEGISDAPSIEEDRNFQDQHAETVTGRQRLQRDGESASRGIARKPGAPLAFVPYSLFGTAIALVVLLGIAYGLFHRWRSVVRSGSGWVQVTNFPDYATSPALSADGRLMAFIRGPETFVTPGQIYVKVLPDGQPIQLTHDNAPKMAPSFAPDGSRIAYTATNSAFGWNTWTVSVLGGEPQQMLPNAAALTWVDRQHVLFSEIRTGVGMALATATESRAAERDVYVPKKMGMAHRSWLSPDRKWVLVSEMDNLGWQPCRVLPFDGSSSGETVGPAGRSCTYAGWSPDGTWMYFSVDSGDRFHTWRQRFPKGEPEQITSGPTEEEGIAVAPDGKSLVTSVGIRQGSLWLHDANGDREISGESFASVPGNFAGIAPSVFSPDGKKLFYLVRKEVSRAFGSGELWMADLASGRSEAVLPGILMKDFDLAPDGKRIAFTSLSSDGNSRVWTAPLDRSAPPQPAASFEADSASFGTAGDLFFQGWDGDSSFVYRMQRNDATPRKVIRDPVSFAGISPDGEWVVSGFRGLMALPASGGSSVRICDFCNIGWGPGGKFFYLRLRQIGHLGGGKVFAIRLHLGESLPRFPATGIKSDEDLKGLDVTAIIDMTGKSLFAPGPEPSIYAYTRTTVQRNLFRIPLE